MILRFRGTTPDSVDLANTPLDALSELTELGFYVQDAWSMNNRVTLNLGVRYDKFRIDIAERSAPAGTWVPERTFPRIENVPNWNTVVPRVGVSVNPFGTGRTVLKGSFSIYVGNEAVGVASAVNPMIYSTNRCTWADIDGDRFAQANELSQCSGFSGGVTTRFDPDLKRHFNREYSAGVQHELAANVGLSVMYYRRENRNLRGIRNEAAPPESYTPVTIVNALTGAPLTIYNQAPSTLGGQRNVLVNSPLLDNTYDGVEIAVQRRFSGGASLLAGYHYGKARGSILTSGASTSRDLNDPNNFIDHIGAIGNDEPHQFKLSGSYELPWKVLASGVILAYSGHPRQQTLVVDRTMVPGLTRSSQTVPLQRNDVERYESIALVDLRFGRSFSAGRLRFQPFIDIYNLTNANTVLAEVTTFGSSLGRVSATINPRILKFGAKVEF
jgi:outer membrane receptor protein involved in Fe transport